MQKTNREKASEDVHLDEEQNTCQKLHSCVDLNILICLEGYKSVVVKEQTFLCKAYLINTVYQEKLPVLQKCLKNADEIGTAGVLNLKTEPVTIQENVCSSGLKDSTL